jgi:hypothetical protein
MLMIAIMVIAVKKHSAVMLLVLLFHLTGRATFANFLNSGGNQII